MTSVSVVIPVLNDAPGLESVLSDLDQCRFEVVVVDGGSQDNSVAIAGRHGYQVLDAPANRGLQLNIGARHSGGEWVWLLHADSTISAAHVEALELIATGKPGWGRFDIAFGEPSTLMNLVARAMNRRSRLTGIATGDQGMFVHRTLLDAIGGVPVQPLMEDIELSRRLRRLGRPINRPEPLTTSARRWQRDGTLKTILRMWWFRLRYFFGADAATLARDYYA